CNLRKMEKNPVSFLQEYTMQRMKVTPEYTIISQTTGTHINSFNIRVSFNGCSADGVGSSKKEAKLNAAMKMINMLNIQQPQSSFSSQIHNKSSSSISSIVNIASYSSNNNNNNNNNNSNSSPLKPLSSPSQSPVSPGINYVGKLQEFAALQINGFLPEYELTGASGPPHNPEFTFVCKYQGKSVEAKGSSKKEAKALAAQRMYETVAKYETKLQVVVPETQIQSYIQTITEGLEQVKIFETNKKLMEESVKKAKLNYPKLTTTVQSTTIYPDEAISNYHNLIKKSMSIRDREFVIDKLHGIMETCRSCLFLDDRSTNPMILLKTTLSSINVKVKEVEFQTKSNNSIYSMALETQPVIHEIACGKTRKEAEVTAIFLIAKTLTIMLL
ncbi:hypothetical protein TSAR_014956, partial [Trichomalopsis sarcophagae]